MSAGTLHPRLAELMILLADARCELLSVLNRVSPSDANRRPVPDAWSVTQIAEHLRLVEVSIGRTLGGLVRRADLDALGPETDTSSVLGVLDRYRLEERRTRLPAPAMVTPGENADLESALPALKESRERLLIGMLRGIVLAGVTALAAAAPAGAQSAGSGLPYEAMARRIVTALQPARGERAILRSDDLAMPALIPPLREALERAGVDVSVLGFGPNVDLPGELERSSIYVALPLAPATEAPKPEAEALGRWLDSAGGRQVHFHWTGITTGTDGEPITVPAYFDTLHLAALEVSDGMLRHQLARAAELLRNREVRVATPAGTDLRFRIGDRAICLQDGNAAQAAVGKKPLRIDKEIELPAGALRVAPLEETVMGTLVLPMLRVGEDTARMVQLDFSQGRVIDVRAESGVEAVRAMLAKSPALANFRELGIGFNPALVVPATEPAIPYAGYGAGMVRLSLGDNRELGGRVAGGDVRWLFFPDATVTAGSAVLVAGGRLAL